MAMKDTKISQKMKKGWLSKVKNIIITEKKCHIIIISNYFYLEILFFSQDWIWWVS